MSEIRVLDHGYVRLVDDYGSGEANQAEAGMIEAARQSTQGSFRGWDKDLKLLAYLFDSEPQHATPFEFAGATVEVQAPIFVFREWQRHRTQSYNEMSARYAPLPDLKYVPTMERCALVSESNKQAGTVRDSEVMDDTNAAAFLGVAKRVYAECEKVYRYGLRKGVPKEVARIVMPVGQYSRMRAHANLRNWLAFLSLRMHGNAQWEIRQYAIAVGALLSVLFPKTFLLFRRKHLERRDGYKESFSELDERVKGLNYASDQAHTSQPRA